MKYNIHYQSDNFKKWFDMDKVKPNKVDIECQVTTKPMTNKEMLDELKPQTITLSEFAYVLDKKLINKTDWYIGFITDKENITRAVYVGWFVGRGWGVGAVELEYDDQWLAGYRVISRQVTLKPNTSDTQSLSHFDTSEVKEKLGEFIKALQKLEKTL